MINVFSLVINNENQNLNKCISYIFFLFWYVQVLKVIERNLIEPSQKQKEQTTKHAPQDKMILTKSMSIYS